MKIKYKENYLSITKFDDVEFEDFTVLTGVNGSGKSHLLQAIEQKKVIIEGYENSNIVLFNYETFKLENENSFNAEIISQDRERALDSMDLGISEHAYNTREKYLGGNYKIILTLCKEK